MYQVQPLGSALCLPKRKKKNACLRQKATETSRRHHQVMNLISTCEISESGVSFKDNEEIETMANQKLAELLE